MQVRNSLHTSYQQYMNGYDSENDDGDPDLTNHGEPTGSDAINGHDEMVDIDNNGIVTMFYMDEEDEAGSAIGEET